MLSIDQIDGRLSGLTFAEVKGTSAILTCRRFSVGGDRIFAVSRRTGKSVSTLGVLPRRLISSTVAACIKSNSPSLKCLTALRRFLGRI